MKHAGIALLLLLGVSLAQAEAETISRIAAVVNSDIITTNQLDQKLQEHLAKQDRQPSPAQLGVLRQELLSRMIEESLVQQRIKALKLSVSEEEIETALIDVQRKNQLTREALEEAVMAQGLTFDAYRENLRQQIMRYKLVSAEVRSQVDVTEQEVVEYFRAHLDDYREPPEMMLSSLAFPVKKNATAEEKARVRAVAQEALERLRRNEPLETVAAAYKANHGATGGPLGRFADSELTPAFTAALEGVLVGAYSEPVEVGESISLLRVDARHSGGLRQFDSVKFDIRQMIMDQKTDARIKEWTKALRAKAFIDVRL